MLFRPKFCANCGEKVERSEWHIWTSQRFCEVCAIELAGHELLPKVGGGILILIGVFGTGAYLMSDRSDRVPEPRGFVDRPVISKEASTIKAASTVATNEQKPESEPGLLAAEKKKLEPVVPAKTATHEEPVYYCGAATKKGTPCSRRVKGSVRCFQHAGMPAMNLAENVGKSKDRVVNQ